MTPPAVSYTRRSIDEGILPMLTAGDEPSLRSLRQLEAFGQQEPTAILVPSHDPDAWLGLRHVATISDVGGPGSASVHG